MAGGIGRLTLRFFPFGLAVKLGALGLGRFLARPPTYGIS